MLPPQLREFRGSETPSGEEKLEEALVQKQDQQTRKLAAEVRPLLERAKNVLASAGVSAEAIDRDCPVLTNREDMVADVLREARERDCTTVVLGREIFSGLKEIFVGHLADDLLREGQGLTFWVVE